MIIILTPEIEQELKTQAVLEDKTMEQMAIEAMVRGLRNQYVPQTLAELKPRYTLPPGKTIKDMISALPTVEWGEEESDENLIASYQVYKREAIELEKRKDSERDRIAHEDEHR